MHFQKRLEQHTLQKTGELKALFKYCQGAAHVWDVHELGLAKQERALQEKLEEMRRKHDNQNQVTKHGATVVFSAISPQGMSRIQTS